MIWKTWGLVALTDDAPRTAVLATGGRLLILGADDRQYIEEELSPRWRISAVTIPASELRPAVGDLVVWRGQPREEPGDWYIWGGPTRVVSTRDSGQPGYVELCLLEDSAFPDVDATEEDLADLFEAVSDADPDNGVVAVAREWDVLAWWHLAPHCPRCGGASRPIAYGLIDADAAEHFAIGGCLIGPGRMPDYQCDVCGHQHSAIRYTADVDDEDPYGPDASVRGDVVAAGDPFEDLVEALGGIDIARDAAWISFTTPDAAFAAIVKDGANRISVEAYLTVPEGVDAAAWTARQPPPVSGILTTRQTENEEVEVVLAFERPAGEWDWSTDPLEADVASYAAAIARGHDVEGDAVPVFEPAAAPVDISPASAWLLLGDEASFPTTDELASSAAKGKVGIFDDLWTAAKQTQVGDLVLIYFMSPHKAVHFVARAASDAFFDRDIAVNADHTVADEQRWAYLTPLIAIEPIPFADLQAASDDHLILRGRSGKFLRPETIRQLSFKAADPDDQTALDRIVSTPVGRADLPPPHAIDIDIWRTISAGALPLESYVETYLVEPLLRHLLPETHVHQRQHRTKTGVVDYVVTTNGEVVAAIEVKLAIPRPPSGDWGSLAEFRQLRRYIDHLRVPGLPVDAHRVLLVEPEATAPLAVIERTTCTAEELAAVRRLIVRTTT